MNYFMFKFEIETFFGLIPIEMMVKTDKEINLEDVVTYFAINAPFENYNMVNYYQYPDVNHDQYCGHTFHLTVDKIRATQVWLDEDQLSENHKEWLKLMEEAWFSNPDENQDYL